jgi:D-xylose transport system substrate-binding protein
MTLRTGLVALSLALSLAIGWTLSQGTQPSGRSPAGGPIQIGLSLGTLKEERWQRDRDEFVRRAEELGAQVLVQSGNSDGLRQIQDIEALISRGVDCLVVVAFNPAAMQKAVEVAREAGVPIICYDRMITDADVDLYISFNNLEVGKMQAQHVVDRLGGRGAIVRIHGPKTDHTAQLFKQGQDAVLLPLIEAGAIQVVHEDYADGWKPDNAKKIVNAAITSHGPNFQAVLATNDGTAGGAIQALLEEGLAGNVLVTGQDADLAACRRILAGTQSMTVYKPIRALAGSAAEAACALARRQVLVVKDEVSNGYKQVPALLEEVIAVDRDNLMETVVADGFHRREELE